MSNQLPTLESFAQGVIVFTPRPQRLYLVQPTQASVSIVGKVAIFAVGWSIGSLFALAVPSEGHGLEGEVVALTSAVSNGRILGWVNCRSLAEWITNWWGDNLQEVARGIIQATRLLERQGGG